MATGRTLTASVTGANRALHRDQMTRFGHELEWIRDPSLIPDEATRNMSTTESSTLSGQCFQLASWMVKEMAAWTTKGERRLDYGGIFTKYDVPPGYRVKLRDRLRFEPIPIYAPGILAMSEVVAVTPLVATRDGLGKDIWGKVAADSRKFGAQISQNGTDVQLLLRGYLHRDPIEGEDTGIKYLDAAKLKVDEETGITTVTPIDEMLETTLARFEARKNPVNEDPSSGVCVGLQAKAPQGCEHLRTMFDAVWISYSSAAERLIYPNFDISVADVAQQGEPEADFTPIANAGIDRINAEYFDMD